MAAVKEMTIARLLVERGERLAVVETSAGGLISGRLIGIAGASNWFLGGVVPYSAIARSAWLGLDIGSVVSEDAARAFAQAARDRLGADWVLSETGIAGPQTGRRSTKPAGLTCLAISGPTRTIVETITLPDAGRRRNMPAFAAAAIALLHQAVTSEPPLAGR